MATFKSYVKSDLDTFINITEFADVHTINGESVKCVVNDDTLAEPSDGNRVGVYEHLVVVYVREQDLEQPPVDGQEVTLDSHTYLCRSTAIEYGVYVITLKDVEQ